MLSRIYGTAFAKQEELDAYLHQLEEAERRDHRRLGREMDLFHFQEEGPGAIFWHAKGWTLFQKLVAYMRRRQAQAYSEVNTPQVLDRALWETSGHWQTYRENMFLTKTEDERIFALKPMNCPGHVLIFKNGLKSYRDLPVRIAEFASCIATSPRRAARHDARARLHPGRRAYFLLGRPDHAGGASDQRHDPVDLWRLRLQRRGGEALDAAGKARGL